MAGQGTYITGVAQIRDSFLDAKYRDQVTNSGKNEVVCNTYRDLENLFDDVLTTGLQGHLQDFMTQLQDAASNPEKPEIANILLTSAKNIIQTLNSYDNKLTELAQNTQTELNLAVDNVNSILEKIGSLNDQIRDACLYNGYNDPVTGERRMLGPYGPNELMDDRNVLLDELAKYGDIDVTPKEDGRITVKFLGKNSPNDDIILINAEDAELNTKVNTLNITPPSESDSGLNELTWNLANKYGATEFACESGSIASYINVLEGHGGYAANGENSFEGIEYYRNIIDSFASNFATAFNDANASGNPGEALFVTTPAGAGFTAGNIRISDEWMADPMTIIPGMVAGEGKLDNTNLLKMVTIFNDEMTYASPDGSYTEFSGTFEGYISHFQLKLGNQKSYYDSVDAATNSLVNELQNSRDSVSAVSENEEAINMMKFQKAFNASARLITAVDEQLDTIINRMGRVGL